MEYWSIWNLEGELGFVCQTLFFQVPRKVLPSRTDCCKALHYSCVLPTKNSDEAISRGGPPPVGHRAGNCLRSSCDNTSGAFRGRAGTSSFHTNRDRSLSLIPHHRNLLNSYWERTKNIRCLRSSRLAAHPCTARRSPGRHLQ